MPHTLTSQGLVTASAPTGSEVHLVAPGAALSMCGQPLGTRPAPTSFRADGCSVCLGHALDQGMTAVREGGHAYLNLRRIPFQG
jgi:hypothetical protein